jgi:hypothetical protein
MTARQERLLDARDALLIEARKTLRALILVNEQWSESLPRGARRRARKGPAVAARRSGDRLSAMLADLERMSAERSDAHVPSKQGSKEDDRVIDLRDGTRIR